MFVPVNAFDLLSGRTETGIMEAAYSAAIACFLERVTINFVFHRQI